jgi:biotin operon repressor
MAGAKHRMLELLKSNVGKTVSRKVLSTAAGVHDWARAIRTLRQEGWNIESVADGYILHSLDKDMSEVGRIGISRKLRYAILQRDNSTCQRCGRTVKDGITLEIDHKIPVDWGGTNEINNLWTLCNICNGGKKHFFDDFDADTMTEVMKEQSGYRRLVRFFELNPNKIIESLQLQVVSEIRDWTRTVRLIRKKENMNIQWVPERKELPQGGYIYNR